MDKQITNNNMTQGQMLAQAFLILQQSNIYPNSKPADWVKVLLYMHTKGWLYIGYEKEKMAMVAGMYRIKKFNKDTIKTLPKKEEGNVLYIPFFASSAEDRLLPRKLLQRYLSKHKNINRITFYNDDKERVFNRLKERKNGKRKNRITGNA